MLKNYVASGNFGKHTIRLTLMEHDYTGHVTFDVFGNCYGASILEIASDSMEEPERFESDCQLECYDDGTMYSVVLSNGTETRSYEDLEYEELRDMIVAVEIIDYQDFGKKKLFEEG